MSLEAVTQMAKATKKPEKAGKSEEELRAVLKQRLDSLKPDLQEGIKEYEQALKDGLFEDANGEPEGSGEARKEALQRKLTALADRAEKIKDRLDSKEELSEAMPEVSTTYTHPDGKKETITLDIEAKLQDFISFYQKTNIDLPPDFEDTIHDIWDRNQAEIEQAIEQNGFDDMLIIPGNIPLTEIKDKMAMEKGYYEWDSFKQGGSFAGAVSQNVDQPRLILVHKTQELDDRPELASTLNIKGQDAKLAQTLTLEDYIIFQRKYFEETGKHLDEEKAVWVATRSGTCLVYSFWDPGNHGLNVSAGDRAGQYDILGARPSRCFK
jgi:flagellar hook-basal body complex protein FliE